MGDLIEMFKMLKDIETFNNMFKFKNLNCLRGNKFKVYKERGKLNVEKYFFNQRIVDVWNSLLNKVICCNTLIEFKNSLDKTNYYNE